MNTTEVVLQPRGIDLSGTQYLMWLGQTLDPEVPLYNMIHTHRFSEPIDLEAFEAAWESVVLGSDSLRTTIHVVAGVPRSVIDEDLDPRLEVVDLRTEPDPELACREWIAERKLRALPLDRRLWDSALLVIDDETVVWYLCQHHLISDAHSFSLVLEAVSERYGLALAGRLADATELPAYRDHLDDADLPSSSTAARRSADYWAEKSRREPTPTDWYGRTVVSGSTRTDRIVLEVGRERAARLRDIAGTPEFRSVSLPLSMHTIWTTLVFALMHRVGGGADLRVGSPFLARPSMKSKSTIGLFVEVGVLDLVVDETDTFATMARRVQREVVDGMRNVRAGVASAELNRSYDVLVNHVVATFASFADAPVDSEWVHTGYGDRNHSVRIQVTDFENTGDTTLNVDVNTGVFGEVEQRWLRQQLDVLIDRFIEDPTRPIGSFDLLADEQRHASVDDFNDTAVESDRGRTVVQLFEDQVESTPDAVAVEAGDRRITYRELNTRVDRLTDLMLRHGVSTGARIAIDLPRSAEAVIAMLAAQKAGAAWVPIDPAHPATRRSAIIDDADPAVVITSTSGTSGSAVRRRHDGRVQIDLGAPLPDGAELARPELRSGDLAYMIYTSGSTGTPKGTMLTHGGLVNYALWARDEYLDGEPLDFPLYSSLSFDLTITSVYVPLISGGRIVVYQGSSHGDGLEILDVFDDDRVDVVKLTPAHLALLRDSGASTQRVRRLIVGGENLLTELASAATTMLGRPVEVCNEYGPTEAVVGCMLHRFDPSIDTGVAVPIGRPAANAQIHVVDSYGQPVPPGVVGEIEIGGSGVALGYWNRPDLTAERFRDDPGRPGGRRFRSGDLARWASDGRLEFLGRNDHQVKIRGARIELGEIEAALVSHAGVESAVVDVVGSFDARAGVIRNCVTCGLPSNHPSADVDEHGVCRDCRDFAALRHEVDRYFRSPTDLRAELDRRQQLAAGSEYDSLVLVSGGKDSTYMLYQLVREYRLRPLVFLLDNGFISADAIENVRASCADLGVDLHIGSTPHMNEIFADSLERHANVCDGCYKTIYTLSLELARRHRIGTVITGLARGQLFETRLADTFEARVFDPDQIDAMVLDARKVYHRIDDAVTRRLAGDLFADDTIFDDVTILDFYRYVDVGLDEVYRYLAESTVWQRPTDTGRSTNCLINDVGIHVHTTTRGFHNYALPYSWDVRLGHKRRETAIDELDDDIDLARVHQILDEIGVDRPKQTGRSDLRLAAYVVPAADVDTAELRRHLEETLPEYMVPTYFVQLEHLPLTVNGKVDRSALPDPTTSRPDVASAFVAPRNEIERDVHEIWSTVFHTDAIGVHDDFFELGGDSIMCIQVVAEARRRGLALEPRDIFTTPTIAEIASALPTRQDVAGDRDGREPLDRDWRTEVGDRAVARVSAAMADAGGLDAVDDAYPLTPTQLGMLYHSIRHLESDMYFGQGTCRFAPDVDIELLHDCWAAVCERHPATRTRFVWAGLDTPLQVVQRSIELPWEVHDWRGRSPADVERGLEGMLGDFRRDGFAPDAAVLMSFAVVRADAATHFVWNSHHAILDGWAAQLVHGEVLARYAAARAGTEVVDVPREPFRRFVERQRSADAAADVEWWRHELSGVESVTPVPFMDVTTASQVDHDVVVHRIDPASATTIEAFARSERVTVGTMTTNAWGLVLGHYGSRDDVLFGATISGRDEGTAGIEHMIGMLLATVPIRVGIDERPVGVWLRDQQLRGFEARQHVAVGLADIQRVTGVPAGASLFDSIVVVENYPSSDASDAAAAESGPLEIRNPSNFPLALLVHTEDGITIEAVFDRGAFRRRDVERLVAALERSLLGMTADAQRPVRDVPVVPAAEAAAVMAWADGPKADPVRSSLPETIGRRAARRPDAIAVRGPGGPLSYRELDERANQLAHALRDRGVAAGDHVGLVVETDARMLVAILGILRSGAAYVPLDPAVPARRLRHIVDETGMSRFVCLAVETLPVELVDGAEVIALVATDLEAWPTTAPEPAPPLDQLAYILYTSGSTGAPKGVMVSHANLAHSTDVRRIHYGGEVGTFLLVSSLAFDSSMVGVFWTLRDGGTIVLPDGDRRLEVTHLGELVAEHDVTHLLALPSLYRLLVDGASVAQLDSLRTVIVAGEACPAAVVEAHRRTLPGAELHNEYGPTEGTVWSHATRLDDLTELAPVPIGRPIPNSSGIVVDAFGHLLPVGVPGELLLGGPGVASGYVARPDETRSAFVHRAEHPGSDGGDRWYRTGDLCSWRDDGMLDFVGRIDDQVKVRGHRVELSDIEAAVTGHPAVRQAAARAIESTVGDPSTTRIVVWFVSDELLDDDSWRAFLSTRLPDYMVPSRIVAVEAMPLTSTGKIDRDVLEVPADADRGPTDDIVDPLERELLDIWQSVLGRTAVGRDDDFFELGGNSLDAMRVSAQVERRTGRALQLSQLLEAPTVAGLAERMRRTNDDRTSSAIVPIRPDGYKRPFFYVGPHQISVLELIKIAKHFDPERPFYGLQAPGLRADERILDTIEDIAAHLVEELSRLQPRGPYLIGGHCDGSWTALEMARMLTDRGESVAYLGLVDLPPPIGQMPEQGRLERIVDRVRYYRSQGRLLYAIAWQIRLRAHVEVLLRFGGSAARRERDVRLAHGSAFQRYEVEHEPRVPVHMVRSTEMAVLMDRIPWYDEVSDGRDGVTTTDITSTHARLLMEPETEQVAAALAAGLDAADDGLDAAT